MTRMSDQDPIEDFAGVMGVRVGPAGLEPATNGL